MPHVTKKILPNGFTILFEEHTRLPLVSMELWVSVGSSFEQEKEYGISHVVEHMVFKDTKRYPHCTLARDIESIGGNMNAATSFDFTCYYVELASAEYERGARVLAECAQGMQVNPLELEKEKNVVIEEISRGEDDPYNRLWESLFALAFKGHAYARPIIGTRGHVQSFTDQMLMSYYQTHYTPERMTLVVVGNVSCDIVQQYEHYFSSLTTPPAQISRAPIPFLSAFTPSRIIQEVTMPIHDTYIAYAWHIPRIDEEYALELDVASVLLGKGISSRLFRQVKETKKLVWSIGCDIADEKYGSLFVVYATAEYDKCALIEQAIREEIKKLAEDLSEEELEKAKIVMMTDYYMGMETFANRGHNMGWHAHMGNEQRLFSFVHRIQATTVTRVKEAIGRYLRDGYYGVVVRPL